MKDSFDSSETLPFGESVYLMTRTDNNNNNNKISMAQKGSVFFLSYINLHYQQQPNRERKQLALRRILCQLKVVMNSKGWGLLTR